MNEAFLNDQLFADFCKHLSASLNAVDLVVSGAPSTIGLTLPFDFGDYAAFR